MNILWFSWKDSGHPLAGGAETVSSNIMQRLARDGHTVRLITATYPGAKQQETVNGVVMYRIGGRYSVYLKARKLYKQQMKDWSDLIIDEMNTIPFGVIYYTKERSVLLTYQLARKVWFYQMVFPISLLGFMLEPLYLFTLSKRYKSILTESASTKKDLARFGFKQGNVSVFRIGMALEPAKVLSEKHAMNRVVFLGALRPMKQALDAVKAFEFACDANPDLTLTLAGDNAGSYAQKVTKYIAKSRHKKSITIAGRVTGEEKLKLLREASLILVTSVKEGWGLIVTEANSQGTPAITYDTDGLRDSVKHNETGLVVPYRNMIAMAEAINTLLADRSSYNRLRSAAWEWSKEFTFENSYNDFCSILGIKNN